MKDCSERFVGLLDEIRVYNVAITPTIVDIEHRTLTDPDVIGSEEHP